MANTVVWETIGFEMLQFQLLAKSFELSEVFLFQQKSEDEFHAEAVTQEQYNRCLFEMVKDQLLIPEADGLKIADHVKRIFSVLKNADKMLMVEPKRESEPISCIYPGKGEQKDFLLIAQPGTRSGEYIRFGLMQKDVLQDWFLDHEDFPSERLDTIHPVSMPDFSDFPVSESEWILADRTRFLLTFYDLSDHKIRKYVAVYADLLADYLLVSEGKERSASEFTIQKFSELLENILV